MNVHVFAHGNAKGYYSFDTNIQATFTKRIPLHQVMIRPLENKGQARVRVNISKNKKHNNVMTISS